jgi:hypothetical protein
VSPRPSFEYARHWTIVDRSVELCMAGKWRILPSRCQDGGRVAYGGLRRSSTVFIGYTVADLVDLDRGIRPRILHVG